MNGTRFTIQYKAIKYRARVDVEFVQSMGRGSRGEKIGRGVDAWHARWGARFITSLVNNINDWFVQGPLDR